MTKAELDVSFQLCPLPVIKTQQAIASLVPGDELTVYATDPTTRQDIPSWCRIHGHQLLSQAERDQRLIFIIQVASLT